jgi:hypothetical protein
VAIARRANYDRNNGVRDPLNANNPIQARELRQMHDQELLRRTQYDHDNGPPDDLYIIPTAYAPSASPGAVNNFSAFSRRLRTIRYPQRLQVAIEKYDGCSDTSIWLKMYGITTRVSGGNEDHMAGYFPLVMGKAPLLRLNNLHAECITSWPTLSQLFTTNYQATYNHPGNTHHLARVRMSRDETLREYTNQYFENRNTLAGVKYKDVIVYYKKGVPNIKLFDTKQPPHTIADVMAYVDKLVATQDTVMHDFNGEDHNDGGSRSCKRSGKVHATDPPKPSTFLEGDFNMVMDDQFQFHRDAKHTMRDCEQLMHALGVPPEAKKTKSGNSNDQNSSRRYDNRNRRPDRRDYCDRRTYHRNDERDCRDYRRDYRRDDHRDDRHDDYHRDDRREDNRNDWCDECHDDRRDDRRQQGDHNRNDNNHKEPSPPPPPPPPKGGYPNGAFQTANRQINFIVGGFQEAKSNRQQRSNAREINQVNETPQPLRWSEYPITFSRKDHWVHTPGPRTYPLVVNPIVDGMFLPKTIVDEGSSLNIILTETLRKMDFNFNKMTTCNEPFYGVVPNKAVYPIGRLCLPVTFGTKENFRIEY